MNNYKPNYEHFADIVALSVGRVLENERKKGSTYSYGTFCVNLEHQIGSHFGTEPEQFFAIETEENNYIEFSKEVVNLISDIKNKKDATTEDYKKVYEEVITLMNKYKIEIINTDDYWNRWSNDNNSKTI